LNMDYRRLQHSYPPRPSPLGASQEPRDPQQFPTSFTESRQETDKPRPYPSPSSNTTPSPSQLYQSGALRTSNTSRDTSSAYIPRNGPTQVHRRHGSLETRNHEQTHRRNNSQPQTVRYREGKQSLQCLCLLSLCPVPMPQIQDSKDRTCAVVGLYFVTFEYARPEECISCSHRIWMVKFPRNLKFHPALPPLPLPKHTRAPDGFSPVAQIDWTTARER
jgi:hypothetical protein